MKPGRRLAPRISAALFALALPALAFMSACSDEPEPEPSYMVVELMPTKGAIPVTAAHVAILDAGNNTVTWVCVNLEGGTTGSFVLQRNADKPAATPVKVVVTGYDVFSGHDSVDPGRTFSCSQTAPTTGRVGLQQEITLGFCEGQSRVLRFHVGASCTCGTGETCGAGLSTGASHCDGSECCKDTVANACSLIDVVP
jgi:hypothetical protein